MTGRRDLGKFANILQYLVNNLNATLASGINVGVIHAAQHTAKTAQRLPQLVVHLMRETSSQLFVAVQHVP